MTHPAPSQDPGSQPGSGRATTAEQTQAAAHKNLRPNRPSGNQPRHRPSGSSLDSLSSSVLPRLDDINKKVDSMRTKIESDPENLGDKVLKLALPLAAGFVFTQILEQVWKRTTKDDTIPRGDDESTNILKAVVFAAISGGLAAIVSRLSTKGSKALVNHRQIKRSGGSQQK